MPFDFDVIRAIVEHGFESPHDETVDPSTHPVLREAGTAMVTTYIERLALYQIIADPFPVFGQQGGMWIGYRLTAKGRTLAQAEPELRRTVADMTGGPKSEVSEAVTALIEECTSHNKIASLPYREDFLASLKEIWVGFDNECFNSVIALCGKVMECCLKEILLEKEIAFEPTWSITDNALLNRVDNQLPDRYISPAMQNVKNIIRNYRVTAINTRNNNIQAISRDQAIMVIYAMQDLVKRYLAN